MIFFPSQKLKSPLLILLLFSFLFSLFLPLASVLSQNDYGLSQTADAAGLQKKELIPTIGHFIKILLTVIGVLLIIIIIIGGIIWMTSAGEEDKIKKAKNIITSAVIGVLIIILAYTITHFVITNLTNVKAPPATDNTTGTQSN